MLIWFLKHIVAGNHMTMRVFERMKKIIAVSIWKNVFFQADYGGWKLLYNNGTDNTHVIFDRIECRVGAGSLF